MENVALQQKSYQTNIFEGFDASRAVDGGLSYSLYSGSCTHTHNTANAYWEVDLADRLRDVELYVGLTKSNYQRYGYHKGVVGSDYTFQLAESVIGQWVRITRILSVVDYLTLCEVQVFAFNAAKSKLSRESKGYTNTKVTQRDTNHIDSTSNDDSKISSSCVHCAEQIRVEKVSQLQSGQHIAVQGRNSLHMMKRRREKK
ncbi:fucolectin-like [Mercenaria mercenaria]|uniref:fucolectin-like n=1 Tax=Mercenaria mercenaria TaxID=6596 RepID=UPI00234EB57D|nr:fucolectin-like [Mercenaria mercenaria]